MQVLSFYSFVFKTTHNKQTISKQKKKKEKDTENNS